MSACEFLFFCCQFTVTDEDLPARYITSRHHPRAGPGSRRSCTSTHLPTLRVASAYNIKPDPLFCLDLVTEADAS